MARPRNFNGPPGITREEAERQGLVQRHIATMNNDGQPGGMQEEDPIEEQDDSDEEAEQHLLQRRVRSQGRGGGAGRGRGAGRGVGRGRGQGRGIERRSIASVVGGIRSSASQGSTVMRESVAREEQVEDNGTGENNSGLVGQAEGEEEDSTRSRVDMSHVNIPNIPTQGQESRVGDDEMSSFTGTDGGGNASAGLLLKEYFASLATTGTVRTIDEEFVLVSSKIGTIFKHIKFVSTDIEMTSQGNIARILFKELKIAPFFRETWWDQLKGHVRKKLDERRSNCGTAIKKGIIGKWGGICLSCFAFSIALQN